MFKKILLFSIMLLMAAVFTFTVKSEAKMMNGKGMTKIEKMRKFRKMVMFFKRQCIKDEEGQDALYVYEGDKRIKL